MTFSPASPRLAASSAVKEIFPVAAPGEAGNPSPIGDDLARTFGSKLGWSNVSSDFGSIRKTASFGVITPSSTRSHAIFNPAAAVRFPLRVCKK